VGVGELGYYGYESEDGGDRERGLPRGEVASGAAGRLATVAMKIPELTTATAVPRACSLTRAMAAPAPNTQNPPIDTPNAARAASITPMSGAMPPITSETRTSALL
jgi:hypothetical protein